MKLYFSKITLIIFLLTGGNTLRAQGSGNTLTFNGSDRYIDLGTTIAGGARTIEMWFKPDVNISSPINDAISLLIRDYNYGDGASTNEFGFYFTPTGWSGMSGGCLVFYRRVGSAFTAIQSNSNSWQAGVWYHVAGVIDPTSGMKMYVNGMLQSDTDPSTQPVQPQTGSVTDMVAIGTWGYWGAVNPGNRYFNGEIDEVRFWNYARSQTQIRDKLCSKLNGSETGLMAYYKFDSASGTTLMDATGNSSNGTLSGFPTTSGAWHYSSAPIGDTSIYVYPVSNFSLFFQPGDDFAVSNITGTSSGAHIYHVASIPNSTSGLTNTPANYYGVWLTGVTGNYDINYTFSQGANCSCGKMLYSRNDNAVMNWTQLSPTVSGCSFIKTNESSVGAPYHAEYITNQGQTLLVNLGNDTTICDGEELTLNAGNSNGTVNWSNGSSSNTIAVSNAGIYSVTVTVNGCSVSDTLSVSTRPTPIVSLGNDSVICGSGETSIILNTGNTGAFQEWNNGSTSETLVVSQPGQYWVRVTENDCTGADTINFTALSLELGPDISTCDEGNLILQPLNSHPASHNYLWSNGDTTFSTIANVSGTYWLNIQTDNCNVTDTVLVVGGIESGRLYVPNAFTPDDNHVNDEFRVFGTDITDFTMKIFNRWGQLIFESENLENGWDGKFKGNFVPEGTYVWMISYSTACSFNKEFKKTGHLTLIRQ